MLRSVAYRTFCIFGIIFSSLFHTAILGPPPPLFPKHHLGQPDNHLWIYRANHNPDRLKDQASAIKAEADKKADAIAQQAKAQADAVKQNAKQESDRIVKEAGQIKDNAIGDANQLSAEAASKTKAIQDSIAKDKQNAAPPAAQQ